MQIGEVADRTGLSLRTIRHYEEAGLIAPSARSKGGSRLYTEADVSRLMVIRRMKPLGFSLEEMRDRSRTGWATRKTPLARLLSPHQCPLPAGTAPVVRAQPTTATNQEDRRPPC